METKKEMMGVTFQGSVTFQGPMFDIHDNQQVTIVSREQKAEKSSKGAPRHRPSSRFEQFVIDPAQAEKVTNRLHELIDGKLPKNCALTIFAAQRKGWLTMPSYKALSDEFPEIGDRKNYTYYLSRRENYKADIDSIEKGL